MNNVQRRIEPPGLFSHRKKPTALGTQRKLKRHVQMIVNAKRLVAIRTLPRPRRHSFLDAVFAEDMAAGFEGGVFEFDPADCADG